ncbi:MAG: SLC13 family permease [Hyphomonadaceae bacterium]|nr:SLC13 family permease [Hyphomonadaceae bacterium]
MSKMSGQAEGPRSLRQKIGLVLGPVLALGLQFLPLPDLLVESTGGLAEARSAWTVLSLLIFMAVWWVTEAIPIPVTSLLPLVILPVFGVSSMQEAASPYMHRVVVLLMGGFIVAKAIERWHLHERIALSIVAQVGDHPKMLVAGFMGAAALLSMWISNTATSIMMMPIAISVAAAILGGQDRLDRPFTYALLLGIAYACSIGGLGTPVGTPTNLIVIGYLNDEAGFSIGFLQWMLLGVPTVAVLVPLAWFVLTRWVFTLQVEECAEGQGVITQRRAALGAITVPEQRTLIVFGVIAFLWVFRQLLQQIEIGGVMPFAGVTDHVIAVFGVILCFLIPSGSKERPASAVLDWKSAESIPWGVLLLFGGGMSLATAITATGLGGWIGAELSGLSTLPILAIMVILATVVIFATEVISNIATAAALMPVLGAMALTTGLPVELLAAPLAMAASCAFMLPMATGPNAVVFATGQVTLPRMAAAGFRLNLLAIPVISALVYLIAPRVFG